MSRCSVFPATLSTNTGVYFDDGGALKSVHSVEVYIPWNNTWLDLPPLPDLGDGGDRMDRTRIMFLTGGGFRLHLLGGTRTDWNTGEDSITRRVWKLEWDRGSQTYCWIDSYDPALGR